MCVTQCVTVTKISRASLHWICRLPRRGISVPTSPTTKRLRLWYTFNQGDLWRIFAWWNKLPAHGLHGTVMWKVDFLQSYLLSLISYILIRSLDEMKTTHTTHWSDPGGNSGTGSSSFGSQTQTSTRVYWSDKQSVFLIGIPWLKSLRTILREVWESVGQTLRAMGDK